MYKILHIPTATLVYEYRSCMLDYIYMNNLTNDDIFFLKDSLYQAALVVFRTKKIAQKYLNSFKWYNDVNYEVNEDNYIVLINNHEPEDGYNHIKPIIKQQFEILKVQ